MIAPLAKINLIAGQNNSGKSNVLRVAENLAELITKAPSGLDVPRNNPLCQFEVAINFGQRDEVAKQTSESLGDVGSVDRVRHVREALGSSGFNLQSNGSVWFRYSQKEASREHMTTDAQAMSLSDVYSHINHYYEARGNFSSDPVANAVNFMRDIGRAIQLPRVRMVQASRRVANRVEGVTPTVADELSGTGLIARLGALQSTSLENDDDRLRFAAVNDFVKTVLDDSTANLEIPQAADQINVRRQNLLLPLDNLGTGVAQVIVLAAAATLETHTVVCMEEPEVHLHPLLQRKLLRYLYDRTDNQYLIATHSAHLLDSEIASVFHATYTDQGTKIAFAGSPYQVSAVCYDLGYRPSDLLQTNCVVWVEGPSDRIYIAHWLCLVNPNLREGIDYSIMFYGGRLLNHLTPDDPEVQEFISLRRLNRHLAVVIDSDKSAQTKSINRTKRRIQESMKDPGMVWVTQGRNIENYVPPDLLDKVLGGLYRKALISNTDRWSDALRPKAEKTQGPDKVKVAKEVTRRWTSGLHYLDLHKKVVALAVLIEAANGRQGAVAESTAKTQPAYDLS